MLPLLVREPSQGSSRRAGLSQSPLWLALVGWLIGILLSSLRLFVWLSCVLGRGFRWRRGSLLCRRRLGARRGSSVAENAHRHAVAPPWLIGWLGVLWCSAAASVGAVRGLPRTVSASSARAWTWARSLAVAPRCRQPDLQVWSYCRRSSSPYWGFALRASPGPLSNGQTQSPCATRMLRGSLRDAHTQGPCPTDKP